MTRKSLPLPIIFAPAIIAIAIFVAYLFVWLAGARQMKSAVMDFAADQRSAGGAATIGGFKATGFPFFLRGALRNVELASGEWKISASKAFIDAQPFSPTRFIISSRDPFTVNFGGDGEWRIDAPDGRASIARDKERGWELDVEAGRSRLTRIDKDGLIEAQSFLLSASPSAVDQSRVFFGVNASKIVSTEPDRKLAFDVADLAFAVSGLDEKAKSLKAWRDAGGVIDIQRAAVADGDAKAEVAGSIAIDAAGYPSGRLDAKVGDPAPFVAALAAAGVIRAKDVDNARTALTLIAIANGGKISAPLELEDGEARVAGVRIGKLKPIIREAAAVQP